MSYYRKIFELISEAALLEKSKESRLKDFELKQKHGLLRKRPGNFGSDNLHVPGISGSPGSGGGGTQAHKINKQTGETELIYHRHGTNKQAGHVGKSRGRKRETPTSKGKPERRSIQAGSDHIRAKLIKSGKLDPKFGTHDQRRADLRFGVGLSPSAKNKTYNRFLRAQQSKEDDWSDEGNMKKI